MPKRLLEPKEGELTPEAARYLLSLDLPEGARERMHHLAAKARAGTLGAEEQAELDNYERIGDLLSRMKFEARQALAGQPERRSPFLCEIPAGIKRAQEAFRRDLPQLLENRKLRGGWAAYHDCGRIGIAQDAMPLLRECVRRGLRGDDYYIGWIDPTELIQEEELDPAPPALWETEGEVPPAM